GDALLAKPRRAIVSNMREWDRSGPWRANPEFVAVMFNRGCLFHTIGIRFFYTAFPIGASFFGDLVMLFTTILLVVLMFFVDSASYGVMAFETDRDRDDDRDDD
ncbi:hypothetical protein HK101_004012, partial [Irineochytrium annulatum]